MYLPTGKVQSGKSKGQPNSAGLLTARESNQPETERLIRGLYMVNVWNYYINKNYLHQTTWNSRKYRYFDNVWTAQILKDIIALKTDEEQIKEAKNFLEYFCQINALDMDNIPEANGALKQ